MIRPAETSREYAPIDCGGTWSASHGFSPGRARVRQLLIPLVVPGLINDYKGRAMHDRATGTAVVRSR